MRHPFLIGASVLVVAALAFAPSAPAQCAEVLKSGTSIAFEVASTDGTIGGKGTLKVEKNDGSYIEITVTTDKGKVLMPGGIDGNRVILTNPQNGNVWVVPARRSASKGTSTLAGKAMKLKALKGR